MPTAPSATPSVSPASLPPFPVRRLQRPCPLPRPVLQIPTGKQILKAREESEEKKEESQYSVMASRLDYVQCMKFFAMLTTNYSQVVLLRCSLG